EIRGQARLSGAVRLLGHLFNLHGRREDVVLIAVECLARGGGSGERGADRTVQLRRDRVAIRDRLVQGGLRHCDVRLSGGEDRNRDVPGGAPSPGEVRRRIVGQRRGYRRVWPAVRLRKRDPRARFVDLSVEHLQLGIARERLRGNRRFGRQRTAFQRIVQRGRGVRWIRQERIQLGPRGG